MPTIIKGGGDPIPKAPGVAPGTEITYDLTVPKDTEVANVPADMTRLVGNLIAALDARLTEASAELCYQKKIVVRTTRPTAPGEYENGTIIFVVGA